MCLLLFNLDSIWALNGEKQCVQIKLWGIKLRGMFGLGEMAGVTRTHGQEARFISERTSDPSETPTTQRRKGYGLLGTSIPGFAWNAV